MTDKKLTLIEIPQTNIRLKNIRKNSILFGYHKSPGEGIKGQEKKNPENTIIVASYSLRTQNKTSHFVKNNTNFLKPHVKRNDKMFNTRRTEVSFRIQLLSIVTSNSLSEDLSIKYNIQARCIFKSFLNYIS